MKLILTLIAVLLSGSGRGWAETYTDSLQGSRTALGKWHQIGDKEIEAEERSRRSNPYNLGRSTMDLVYENFLLQISTNIWIVSRGTESYTLDNFISTGKFCEDRGHHEWDDYLSSDYANNGCYRSACIICHRCRQKVKFQREEWRWEK